VLVAWCSTLPARGEGPAFAWPPPASRVRVGLVIPSSNLSIYPDVRFKTRLAGEFARVASIFRVSSVAVFRDPDAEEPDHRLFVKVLRYVLVPPYLRQRVWRLDPELRYAGLLPPLNIYPHNPEGRAPGVGDVRYGLVMDERGTVEVGWSRPCRLVDPPSARVGSVDLFEVVSLEPFLCRKVSRASIYAGYEVVELLSARDLANYVEGFQLVVNTSKRGVAFSRVLSDPGSARRFTTAGSLCLLFGNPRRDLDEIVGEGLRIDLTVNFIPYQGVFSVRTLEAITASLAALNLLLTSTTSSLA